MRLKKPKERDFPRKTSVLEQREESRDGSWFSVCGPTGICVCVEFKGMQEKDEVFWGRAGSEVFLEDAASSRVSEPFLYPEWEVQSHQQCQTGQNSIRCDLEVISKAAPGKTDSQGSGISRCCHHSCRVKEQDPSSERLHLDPKWENPNAPTQGCFQTSSRLRVTREAAKLKSLIRDAGRGRLMNLSHDMCSQNCEVRNSSPGGPSRESPRNKQSRGAQPAPGCFPFLPWG